MCVDVLFEERKLPHFTDPLSYTFLILSCRFGPLRGHCCPKGIGKDAILENPMRRIIFIRASSANGIGRADGLQLLTAEKRSSPLEEQSLQKRVELTTENLLNFTIAQRVRAETGSKSSRSGWASGAITPDQILIIAIIFIMSNKKPKSPENKSHKSNKSDSGS